MLVSIISKVDKAIYFADFILNSIQIKKVSSNRLAQYLIRAHNLFRHESMAVRAAFIERPIDHSLGNLNLSRDCRVRYYSNLASRLSSSSFGLIHGGISLI